MEVVLSIFREGTPFGWLSGVKSGLRQFWRRGSLGWSLHPNIPDSLDVWMPGTGVTVLPKQEHVRVVLEKDWKVHRISVGNSDAIPQNLV